MSKEAIGLARKKVIVVIRKVARCSRNSSNFGVSSNNLAYSPIK